MRYMLDTNIFDFILDNGIPIEKVTSLGELYVTNMQISELLDIPNICRREEIQELLQEIEPMKVHLRSGVWVDSLRWDDTQPWHDNVNPECEQLLGSATKNIPWKDALLAEVAKYNEMILVTNDQKFAARAVRNGMEVMSGSDLFMHIKIP